MFRRVTANPVTSLTGEGCGRRQVGTTPGPLAGPRCTAPFAHYFRRLLVRKPLVLGVLTLLASPVVAQSFWHPAIGIQGGYARIKPAGTGRSDAIDLIEFPTPGYVAP